MYEFEKNNPIVIVNFKWAGKLGPIKIKSSCDECDITTSMLRKMVAEDFKGKNVVFEVKPWLNNIFYCLSKGAWHAPIIIVNDKKFFQFSEKKAYFDRAELVGLINKLLEQQSQTVRDLEHKHVRLSYNQVDDLIFAGNNLCCQSQFDEELLVKGIYADISLEAERLDNPKGVKYFFWLPWKEDTAPTNELIDLGLNVLDNLLKQKIKTYIHCRNGHGRTTTFLAAYFMRKSKIGVEAALAMIKERRPSGHLNRVQREFLDRLEQK